MRTTIAVKSLKNKGYFVSELDTHSSYVGQDNPKGLFKIVILPIDHYLYFKKINDNTFNVYGTAKIITGSSEERIDSIIKEFVSDKEEKAILLNCDKNIYFYKLSANEKVYCIRANNIFEAYRYLRQIYCVEEFVSCIHYNLEPKDDYIFLKGVF